MDCVIERGIKDGFWPNGWKPDHCRVEFSKYLQTKFKNLRRKKKGEEMSEELMNEYAEKKKRMGFKW